MSKDPVRPTPRPLTAEWLRKQAGEGVCFMGDAKDALMLADAIEIADSSARSDIECYCPHVDDRGNELMRLILDKQDRWYDLDSSMPARLDVEYPVKLAERYLESCGLLIRHTDRPRLVRFKEAA